MNEAGKQQQAGGGGWLALTHAVNSPKFEPVCRDSWTPSETCVTLTHCTYNSGESGKK